MTIPDPPAFLLAVLLPLSYPLGGLPAGSPLPLPHGDWVVRTPIVLYDVALTLRGNLIICDGGSLELHGVELRLDAANDGERRIEVLRGGALTTLRSGTSGRPSRIRKGSRPGRYEVLVRRGARVLFSETDISGAGWERAHPGAVIEGEPGEEDGGVIVFAGKFHDNFVGLTLRGEKRTVMLTEFTENQAAGLALEDSRASLTGLVVSGETIGVRLSEGSDALLDGVQFVGNDVAIAGHDVSLTIAHSVLASNRIHVDLGGNGAPVVRDSVLLGAREAGVRVRDASAPRFDHNDFASNAVAVLDERESIVPPLAAQENYWGAPDGPSGAGPGSGDPVSDGVAFAPWCTESCAR